MGLGRLGCERDGEVFRIPAVLLSELLSLPPDAFRDRLLNAECAEVAA
jgi:hypothetical protein